VSHLLLNTKGILFGPVSLVTSNNRVLLTSTFAKCLQTSRCGDAVTREIRTPDVLVRRRKGVNAVIKEIQRFRAR
jgi:hypothetical protein